MTIKTSRLTPALGAIVEGVAIAEELPRQSIDRLGELLVEHHILFFRRQPLTPQQQCRFAACFGELHVHPIYPVLPELPEILVLDTHGDFLPDNDNWHTDVTFSPTPPLAGLLAAKQLPSVGGDTLWSSNLAAYGALSEPMKRLLDGLTAEHSVVKSFPAGRWGADPASRRKGLFVNEGFTTHIHELSSRESDALLSFLFAHGARLEFIVRWQW